MSICRINRVCRREMKARLALNLAIGQLDAQCFRVLDQPGADVNDCSTRHGKTKQFAQARRQHFVRKNADMLRIILEFCDVALLVGGTEELRLRSSSQAGNVLDCGDACAHRRTPGDEERGMTQGVAIEESSPEDRTLTRERASAELRNAQSRKSWQRKGPEQPRSLRFLRFEIKQRDLAHATAEKIEE